MVIINNKHSFVWYKIKRTKNLLSINLDYFLKCRFISTRLPNTLWNIIVFEVHENWPLILVLSLPPCQLLGNIFSCFFSCIKWEDWFKRSRQSLPAFISHGHQTRTLNSLLPHIHMEELPRGSLQASPYHFFWWTNLEAPSYLSISLTPWNTHPPFPYALSFLGQTSAGKTYAFLAPMTTAGLLFWGKVSAYLNPPSSEIFLSNEVGNLMLICLILGVISPLVLNLRV